MNKIQNIGLTTEGTDYKSAPAGKYIGKIKMKKNIIFFVVICMFLSCIQHPKTDLNNQYRTSELLKKVLEEGDTTAYYEISVDFFMDDKSEHFLYYALIMANKYNNRQANYDVYNILTYLSCNKIETLDSVTKNLALYHLEKAKELGYNGSIPRPPEGSVPNVAK